jgi:hypothetical protein
MRALVLVPACLLAACGASSPVPAAGPDPLTVALLPAGGGYRAAPVTDELGSVSHNASGYTGEIDRYALVAPIAGRLQVSLSWDHAADYDLILAADPEGTIPLASGLLQDDQPEYVGTEVAAGQIVQILVVGFEGEPGPYRLETALLPPGSPPFDLVATPDFSKRLPRNLPLVFTFSEDLDPFDPVGLKVLAVGGGQLAIGAWCVEGKDLVFLPRLPTVPGGGDAGLLEEYEYLIQFPRASQGPHARNGEYLDEFITIHARFSGFADEAPDEPPRVVDVDRSPFLPWTGGPLSITLLGALDPARATAQILLLGPLGEETPFPAEVHVEQDWGCLGPIRSRIVVDPAAAFPKGARLRVRVPDTVLGISGEDIPANRAIPFVADF